MCFYASFLGEGGKLHLSSAINIKIMVTSVRESTEFSTFFGTLLYDSYKNKIKEMHMVN